MFFKKQVMIQAVGAGKLRIFGTCTVTKQEYSVEVDHSGWQKWQNGAMIQDALPDLTGSEREFLLNGTTPAEWDSMFAPEEEGLDY